MRLFYAMFLFLIASDVLAQSDTITLTNGRTIIGTDAKFYNGQLIITDKDGDNYLIKYNRIERMNVALPMASNNGTNSYQWSRDVAAMQDKYRNTFLVTKEDHLKMAGDLGISAAVLQIIGAAIVGLSYAIPADTYNSRGYVTGSNSGTKAGMLYTGAVLAGAGFVMYIPTFIFLRKAGTTPRYQIP